MRRIGLALQVTGVLLIASGLAAALTTFFLEDTLPVPVPSVAAGSEPGVALIPLPPGTGSLPRVLAPGAEHDAVRYRVVPLSPDTGAEVALTLVLTPGDGGEPMRFTERVTLGPTEGAKEVALAPRFDGLPAPGWDGVPWTAQVAADVVARGPDGTERRWSGEAPPVDGFRSAPPWIGEVFAAGGLGANLLQAAALAVVGGGLLAAGLRRFRIEYHVVRIRPAILTGLRRPGS